MFANQNIGERGLSRPLVVGLMLLLLFLTTTQDWSNGQPATRAQLKGSKTSSHRLVEEVREKLIHNLTIENEKLERELQNLREEILHMRRAFRTELHGGNGSQVLAESGISFSEEPGQSNMSSVLSKSPRHGPHPGGRRRWNTTSEGPAAMGS